MPHYKVEHRDFLNPEVLKVLCQPRGAAVDFTWSMVLGENRRGALPWPALVRQGPVLAVSSRSSFSGFALCFLDYTSLGLTCNLDQAKVPF